MGYFGFKRMQFPPVHVCMGIDKEIGGIGGEGYSRTLTHNSFLPGSPTSIVLAFNFVLKL